MAAPLRWRLRGIHLLLLDEERQSFAVVCIPVYSALFLYFTAAAALMAALAAADPSPLWWRDLIYTIGFGVQAVLHARAARFDASGALRIQGRSGEVRLSQPFDQPSEARAPLSTLRVEYDVDPSGSYAALRLSPPSGVRIHVVFDGRESEAVEELGDGLAQWVAGRPTLGWALIRSAFAKMPTWAASAVRGRGLPSGRMRLLFVLHLLLPPIVLLSRLW